VGPAADSADPSKVAATDRPGLTAASTPPDAAASPPRWLPPVAIAAFAFGTLGIISIAGSTLGYDFQAYLSAAQRLLHGQRLYDPSVSVAGGFAIYLYPPPFALAIVPFALLPSSLATWGWLAAIVAAFVVGVAVLPVRTQVRWTILLLAGISWPFLYSVKLGQVGPLLFCAFAVGWRALDRPVPLGLSIAAGALIKVQPGLLFGWALVTRRRRALLVCLGALVAAALVVTPLVGLGAWSDYVELLRRVSSPVTTPHNFTPGAIAYQLGASESTATAIQVLAMGGALAISVLAWFRADAESSYVVTVVASQLLSPLLWDHYAMLLLIPTALLLQRGHLWAVLIPLAGWLPAPIFPVLFGVSLIAPLVARDRRRAPVTSPGRVGEAPTGA
jgi:hypothetical protein